MSANDFDILISPLNLLSLPPDTPDDRAAIDWTCAALPPPRFASWRTAANTGPADEEGEVKGCCKLESAPATKLTAARSCCYDARNGLIDNLNVEYLTL